MIDSQHRGPNTQDAAISKPPLRVPFFYGWLILAVTFIAMLMSAGIRAAPQTFIKPLEAEFGWSRAAIASAVAISLVLYGAIGPIGGWFQDRRGPRVVMLGALALLCTGVAATVLVSRLWQFIFIWGFVVGMGAGGMSSVLAATVANRWFVAKRGLALGILNGAGSTGQLIFIPLVMAIIVTAGWRAASLVLASIAAGVFLLIAWLMRNDPSDIGGAPLGQGSGSDVQTAAEREHRIRHTRVIDAMKTRTFWLLCGTYYVCGGTTNGLIGTHMIPHALDIGVTEAAAATTVAIMGFMNLFGTLIAGWLTDRMDSRKLLAGVYAVRGVSLFILPLVTDASGMFFFGVIYGLEWFATVPPVVAISGDAFGRRSVGSVYGWIFLSHQLGGAVSAIGGGMIFQWSGNYQLAFLLGGVMAFAAALMALAIKKNEPAAPLQPPQQELAGV